VFLLLVSLHSLLIAPGSILSSALSSVGIALAAAFVVVLFSSRSFEITLLAIFTIGFILASVTAMLVATGWTLGLYVVFGRAFTTDL
jgi:Gpi18-like mannosyltransferase